MLSQDALTIWYSQRSASCMDVTRHSQKDNGLLTWDYAILKFDDHPREVLMLDVPGPATGVSTSCDMVADNSSIAP